MNKKALLVKYIENKHFHQATELLKAYIKSAEYVDPRDDYSYGPEADNIAYAILEEKGPQAFAEFHEDLLRFFQEELEPLWGPLHKGHFYMRLGLAYLAIDVSKAYENFEKGYQQDRILCQKYFEAGQIADGDIRARLSPNYGSLLIIERSKPEYFETPTDRQTYFAGLSSVRLDVFWEPHDLEPFRVITAINKLTSEPMKADILGAFHEINQAAGLKMMFALPPLISSFIQKLLLSLLYYQTNIHKSKESRLLGSSLLELVKIADDQNLFPKPSIRAFFMMVAIMEMEMSVMDDAEYTHAIDLVTRMRIGWGLKVLLEQALISWAN